MIMVDGTAVKGVRRDGKLVSRIYGEVGMTTGKNLFNQPLLESLSGWDTSKPYLNYVLPLEPNTEYTLSLVENNMHKNAAWLPSVTWAFYVGETQGTYTGNTMIGNTGSAAFKEKYTFTTTDKPYYANLYVSPRTQENLDIVWEKMLIGLMIEKGASATAYEPYDGGVPAPIRGKLYDFLPSEFQRVEYLESTVEDNAGNQFIDTGFIPTSRNLKIRFNMYCAVVPTAERDLVATSVVGTNGTLNSIVFGQVASSVFLYTNGDTNVRLTYADGFTVGESHTVELDFNGDTNTKTLTVDGQSISGAYTTNIVTKGTPLCLMGANGFRPAPLGTQFPYAAIWQDGELVRYLIPCYRKSDNEPGMYDLVYGGFHVNGGTGDDFGVGADV